MIAMCCITTSLETYQMMQALAKQDSDCILLSKWRETLPQPDGYSTYFDFSQARPKAETLRAQRLFFSASIT
jgi:hypothetical protein